MEFGVTESRSQPVERGADVAMILKFGYNSGRLCIIPRTNAHTVAVTRKSKRTFDR